MHQTVSRVFLQLGKVQRSKQNMRKLTIIGDSTNSIELSLRQRFLYSFCLVGPLLNRHRCQQRAKPDVRNFQLDLPLLILLLSRHQI